MQRGFTIKIFVPGGSVDGLRIVEKSNWNGRGIVCPRANYADYKTRAGNAFEEMWCRVARDVILVSPSVVDLIRESDQITRGIVGVVQQVACSPSTGVMSDSTCC